MATATGRIIKQADRQGGDGTCVHGTLHTGLGSGQLSPFGYDRCPKSCRPTLR